MNRRLKFNIVLNGERKKMQISWKWIIIGRNGEESGTWDYNIYAVRLT